MSASQLHLTLAEPAERGHSGAVLAAEVIGPAVGEVRRMPLQTGSTTTLDVPPGSYLVRVASPDGALTDVTVEVADGETRTMTLSVPSWAAAPTDRPVAPPTPDPGQTHAPAWAQLWRGGESIGWTGAELPGSAPGRWNVSYGGMDALHHLQVGGPGSAWRTIALPPAQSSMLTVTAVPARGDFDDGLHVEVSSGDATARAMLEYLSSGQVEMAQVVAIDVVEMALRAFQDKLVHPEGAAVAGYLLLRMRESDRLRDWGENFANWFPWLPDAQVIHAWQLLNRPGAPDRDVSRSRLLNAVEQGVPRYTDGLRLLFEGLQALCGSDQHDKTIYAALEQVRVYANACDWSAPMTTYWSRSPVEPSLVRRTGWPKKNPHVARLG